LIKILYLSDLSIVGLLSNTACFLGKLNTLSPGLTEYVILHLSEVFRPYNFASDFFMLALNPNPQAN
jgi:hypothetical protein